MNVSIQDNATQWVVYLLSLVMFDKHSLVATSPNQTR